jgi:hypothetical protein
MNKIRCCIVDFYRLVIVISIVFTTWKFVRYWHAVLAERTSHAMDASIGATGKKPKKTATALEK